MRLSRKPIKPVQVKDVKIFGIAPCISGRPPGYQVQLWGNRVSVSTVVVDMVNAQLKERRDGSGVIMIHAHSNIAVCRRADRQGL